MNKEEELIDRLIDLAFAEDIGDGDHTTLSCIPATAMGKSKLLIKEPGILAGIEIAKEVFRRFDPYLMYDIFVLYFSEETIHPKVSICGHQDTVFVANGASDAEHHAAHEWHCHHDT